MDVLVNLTKTHYHAKLRPTIVRSRRTRTGRVILLDSYDRVPHIVSLLQTYVLIFPDREGLINQIATCPPPALWYCSCISLKQ